MRTLLILAALLTCLHGISRTVTINFNSELFGNANCNLNNRSYTVDGVKIEFKRGQATFDRDPRFDNASQEIILNAASNISSQGNIMTLAVENEFITEVYFTYGSTSGHVIGEWIPSFGTVSVPDEDSNDMVWQGTESNPMFSCYRNASAPTSDARVKWKSMRLTLVDKAGIGVVTADGDDTPVSYYTLQGLPVEWSEGMVPGVYIMRKGSKAYKIVVR